MATEGKKSFKRKIKPLAEALFNSGSPKDVKWLRQLMEWPGAPKKTRGGWFVEDWIEFLQANAEKIQARKNLATVASVDGKSNQKHLDFLGRRGNSASRTGDNNQSGNGDGTPGEGTRPTMNGGMGDGGAVPSEITTQAHLANFLQARFNFPCSEQDVSDWKREVRKPSPTAPPFPSASGRGSWDRERILAACDWFERWIVSPARALSGMGQLEMADINLPARALSAKHQQAIDDAALKRLELEQAQRADDRNYILRAEHRGIITGTHKVASDVMTIGIERWLPEQFGRRAEVLALPEEPRVALLAALVEVCRGVNHQLHVEIPARLKGMTERREG